MNRDPIEDLLEEPKVSVVVCTRNRGDRIRPTLASIIANHYSNFEILVIDQSTNRETEKCVCDFNATCEHIRYIATPTKGTGLSRQLGLELASSEYVLYTDDDCTVPNNWIKVIAEIFVRNPLVAMAFTNVEAAPHNAEAGFVPAYSTPAETRVKSLQDKRRARGIGASMAVRRSAVMGMGGFDPSLGPGSKFQDCEDGDLAFRMLLNGWELFESNRVAINHDGFRTWQEGKDLAKRNWVGIGAACSKPLKCARLEFVQIVFHEAFYVGLGQPMMRLLKLQRPRGLPNFYYFWKGFFQGLCMPVDRKTMLFVTDIQMNQILDGLNDGHCGKG